MTVKDLHKLALLVKQERESLLSRWRQQVRELPSARHLDIPTLNDHIPNLLDELAAALRENSEETIPELLNGGSCPAHGLQRVQNDYQIEEVVSEYNILRGCIHDLADENGIALQGEPFHILNRVFDHAIGIAVETFATEKALEVQRKREEYLAFVTHDLRTPLNAISLAGRVLELSLPEGVCSTEMTQMLKSLRRGVQQLERLVDKILEENVNLETEVGIKLECRDFDLWPLVEALIHDLHPVAGTNSTQLLNRVPVDQVVYADANLLRRVFQNLIANAIKYTPRGEVEIGAELAAQGDAVDCWVRDNGTGIPAELLDRIFEKGETDPENAGGMGLGLAIVKSFTEAHGGTVTVTSEEGIGSTFRISFPKKPPASAK